MKTKTLKPPEHLSAEAKKLWAEPPSHLSAEAQRWWRSTLDSYAIDESAVAVLLAGAEAIDRREQARQAIAQYGAVVLDRFGVAKVSPWIAIERDAAQTLYKSFRLLGLDLAQVGEGKR